MSIRPLVWRASIVALLFVPLAAEFLHAQAPSDPRHGLERGMKLRKQKQYDAAIAVLRRAWQSRPPEELAAEILIEVGQCQYGKGRRALDTGARKSGERTLREALTTFEAVARSYPKSVLAGSACYMIGSTHLLLEETEKALAAYSYTFERFPDYPARARALVRAGVCLAALDRVPEAIGVLRRVMREFPERKGDVNDAGKYLDQLAITGRRFTPLAPRSWLRNMVDSDGLATFRGDVIVLVFMATWCPSCTDSIPHLRRLIDTWAPKGVVFLGVLNPADPKNTETVERYVAESGLDFLDVALVDKQRVWDAYRGERLPAVVVIDRRGVVRWRGHPSWFPAPLVGKALGEVAE